MKSHAAIIRFLKFPDFPGRNRELSRGHLRVRLFIRLNLDFFIRLTFYPSPDRGNFFLVPEKIKHLQA